MEKYSPLHAQRGVRGASVCLFLVNYLCFVCVVVTL